MPTPIAEFLTHDHQRMDTLLDRLIAEESIDDAVFTEFKQGLLQHIRFEETILLPAAREANGGESLMIAARLRLDHGALAAMLVPPPTSRLLLALRIVLNLHNYLEEGPTGVYTTCDRLLADGGTEVIARFKALPPVPLARNTDVPRAMESAARALERAGFSRALLDW